MCVRDSSTQLARVCLENNGNEIEIETEALRFTAENDGSFHVC